MSIERPLVVDWKGLKRMGWPYSRTHTWRLMFDPDYAGDPFPRCRKLGKDRSAHVVWRVAEVLAYLEARGLRVTEDWQVS
jgi:predicted DNA-binding transcriptional regulator AlpA